MTPLSPRSANGSPTASADVSLLDRPGPETPHNCAPCVFELKVAHTSTRGKQLKKPWTHFNLTPTVCGRLSPQSDVRWEGWAMI